MISPRTGAADTRNERQLQLQTRGMSPPRAARRGPPAPGTCTWPGPNPRDMKALKHNCNHQSNRVRVCACTGLDWCPRIRAACAVPGMASGNGSRQRASEAHCLSLRLSSSARGTINGCLEWHHTPCMRRRPCGHAPAVHWCTTALPLVVH